jgi:uncharacterized protein YjbJ (UPF0337 family)
MTTDRPGNRHGQPAASPQAAPQERIAGDPMAGDQQALAQDIERTRERLGETVEALTAKLDVPARARDKAVQLKDRIAAAASETTGKIAGLTGETTDKIAGLTGEATGKIAKLTGVAADTVATKAADLRPQAAPGDLKNQVTTTAGRVTRAARQRPVRYAVSAGVAVVAVGWAARAIRRR